MSYKYLDPADVGKIERPTKEQLEKEGWLVDEEGKNFTNYSYGRTGELSLVWKGDDVGYMTEYMRAYRKGIKKGFNYEARAKQGQPGRQNIL